MSVRLFVTAIVGAWVALDATGAAAQVSAFPSRSVTIVVPQPAGGTSDVVARALGQKLGTGWGQTVVIENKAGAAGNIGAAAVAKSPPDGYTMVISPAALSTAEALYKDPGFRLFDTLVPVTTIATVPFMLVVHPSLPVSTFAQFVEYAKANPDKLALGSGGFGTVPHLSGELLKLRTGIRFTHVPYKGGIQAINDLVAGQVQFTIDGGAHVVTQIEAGRLRLIAVATPKRLPQFPEVPTIAESGLPGFEASAWQMLLVAGGTPPGVVERIHQGFAAAIRAGDMAERMRAQGLVPVASTPAETAAFLRAEMAKWGEVIRLTGAKAE